jgi:predicted nucleotide-binding protein
MGTFRVLVADNSPDTLEATKSVLEMSGYEVVTATSPAGVWQVLGQDDPVDLTILDLRLSDDGNNSDETGGDIAQKMGSGHPRILYSGLADRAQVRDLIAHFDDLVFKTDPVERLLDAVRQTLVPRVFIVHGHDTRALRAVFDHVQDLGFRPIVLQQQASDITRAVIEALERHANRIEFAVVLLTPDDAVVSSGGSSAPDLRARQNVIFELGFFIAKLGRQRVAVLRSDGVEIPSDFGGVLSIPFDPTRRAAWKAQLGKVLSEKLAPHHGPNEYVAREPRDRRRRDRRT